MDYFTFILLRRMRRRYLAATTTAVETAVSGLSFCYSAVADLEADPTTVVAVAMDSEMAAANPSKKFRLV